MIHLTDDIYTTLEPSDCQPNEKAPSARLWSDSKGRPHLTLRSWSDRQTVVASEGMSLWLLFALMGLVKLVVASLMLWIPFRSDSAMMALEDEGHSGPEDEGGTKAPGSPREPHPRLPLPHHPRRGPHGSSSPPSPARVRRRARRVVARETVQR
jgi:hypothetical protein